jgi:hypothetical protein
MKRLLIGGLSAGLLGLVWSIGVAATPANNASRVERAAILANPLARIASGAADCVDCVECTLGHKAYPGDGTSIWGYGYGPHTSCFDTGDCDLQHPQSECNISDDDAADLELVRAALQTDDAATLRKVLTRTTARVAYIPSRRAVQVVSCKGTVVAHFPLDAKMIAGL